MITRSKIRAKERERKKERKRRKGKGVRGNSRKLGMGAKSKKCSILEVSSHWKLANNERTG